MARPLRCFVGVDFHVPRKVRTLIEGLDPLRPAVRPVELDNLHVTLQFLGDAEPGDIRAIDNAMKETCAGVAKFDVELVGVGAFPNADRPSVVWIGIEPPEPLAELAEELGEHLSPLGFPPEARKFTPHLTVARVKSRPDDALFDLLDKQARTPFGRVTLTRAVLFQSDLTKSGAVYAPLSTCPFRG